MNEKVKGYIFGAVAAATYGLNPLFALPLYARGMDADNVLFWRYFIAVPAVLLLMYSRRRSPAVEPRRLPALALMGVLMALSSLLLFESYNYMDAGIASTLLFVYPLMVAVIMALFFRERLTASTVICIGVALAGIFMLFKNPQGGTLSPWGTPLVMISSLCYALYMIGVNRPSLRTIPTVGLIFYVLCCGVMLFGGKIAFTTESHFILPSDSVMWICVSGLAILPTVVSFLCTTLSVQYIGPTPTAILGALEPLTAVVIGISVFGESLSTRDLCGMALILSAVTLVVAGGKITAPLIRFRKLFPILHRKKRK